MSSGPGSSSRSGSPVGWLGLGGEDWWDGGWDGVAAGPAAACDIPKDVLLRMFMNSCFSSCEDM